MTQLFAYRIPDKYFAPHKVVVPFHARVTYSIYKGEVKIEEVSFSESALKYVKMGPQLMNDIREAIEAKANPVHPIINSALAPFITH